jgi:hypothetical protein
MTIKSSVLRARDLLLTGGGAILVALAAAACTTQNPAAAPVPATAPSATPTTSTTASSVAKPTTTPNRKFANTRNFAQLIGYDTTNRMIEFKVLIRYPNADKQDHYSVDPHDSAVHRLPLAPHATVNGISNGGSENCQNTPCTTDQLIAALGRESPGSLIAQLIVDDTDTITMVNEQIGALI